MASQPMEQSIGALTDIISDESDFEGSSDDELPEDDLLQNDFDDTIIPSLGVLLYLYMHTHVIIVHTCMCIDNRSKEI